MGKLALMRKFGQVTILSVGHHQAKIVVLPHPTRGDYVTLSIEAEGAVQIEREEMVKSKDIKR